uniref:Uncharacterized protein n=1 Tax=Heterorhabditis bacteriophora TaxID=37862 RepID=A0A1I7W9R8_HETBA
MPRNSLIMHYSLQIFLLNSITLNFNNFVDRLDLFNDYDFIHNIYDIR